MKITNVRINPKIITILTTPEKKLLIQKETESKKKVMNSTSKKLTT